MVRTVNRPKKLILKTLILGAFLVPAVAAQTPQKISNGSVAVTVVEHGANFSIVAADGRVVLSAGCSVGDL